MDENLQKFFDDIDKEIEKTPIIIRKFYQLRTYVKSFLRTIKYKFQKLNRGFSDNEIWDLDITISEFVLPRLRAFKHNKSTYPAELSESKWNQILEDIIYFHESVVNKFDYEKLYDKIRIKRGKYYFIKYYESLWD